MCGDSTSSGSGGSAGGYGGSSKSDYLPSDYINMSTSDKLDAIDKAQDKIFDESHNMRNAVKSGKMVAGSTAAKAESNRIDKISKELEKEERDVLYQAAAARRK